MSSQVCEYLEWDSSFFGVRIARLLGSRLTLEILEAALAWCRDAQIACLYFLADSDDPQTVWLAEKNRFNLVEIRYILERSLKDWNPITRERANDQVYIREATLADIPAMQAIARFSYVDSRFYFDPHFSETQWADYYATWVKKSVEGGAELRLVAEQAGEILGYITGLVNHEKNQGIYELTGVKPESRRSGVGQELFRSGLDWYVRHNVADLWVATQGRNIATQRMIQRHGFLSKSCQLYYHKWFTEEP